MSKTRETIADVRAERTKLYEQLQEAASANGVLKSRVDELNTSLNTAVSDIADLNAKLTKCEVEKKDAERTKSYYNEQYNALHIEVNALHSILDIIPGAPPRKYNDNGYDRDLRLSERFAAWLASTK